MKLLLSLLLLPALLNAEEETEADIRKLNCIDYSERAKQIMAARQNGVPASEVLSSADDVNESVKNPIKAFRYQRVDVFNIKIDNGDE